MFNKKCLKIGLITMSAAIVASLLPGIYVYVKYGIIPDESAMTAIFGMLIASFLVGWIVQPITFYPAMGTGASCLSWTTGNVAELRMPAISAGQKAAEVEPGTPEGDALSTMSAAISSVVVVIVLTLFTIVGASLLHVLPKAVTSAFSYITPAVFGAIIVEYTMKNAKHNIPLIIEGVLVFIILKPFGVPSVWVTLIVLISGMFLSRLLFVMNKKKAEKKEA